MKRILITVAALSMGVCAMAQSVSTARELYERGAIVACQSMLDGLDDTHLTADERSEKALLTALSAFESDAASSLPILQQYLKTYPDTPQKNRMTARLAEAAYASGDCARVVNLMNVIDMNGLPDEELERLVLTYGMALMGLGETDEARVQLRAAQALGGKYKDEAVFSQAWLDYTEGLYDDAVNGFSAVQNVPAFRDKALFFKAECALEQGDYEEALARAESALSDENGQMRNDLKRVRGEALYGLGRYEESSLQLEEWLAAAETPEREGLFRLGLAHYNAGEYLRAPEVLSLTDDGSDDAIAQSATLYSGLSWLKTGDTSRARMSFERAASMTADNGLREQALYNYIASVHETGYSAFGESVTASERFLNEFPFSQWADKVNDILVETYMSTRNYEAALQSIAKISHPGNALMTAKQQLLCRAGLEACAGGRLDEAVNMLSQSIELGKYDAATCAEALLWRGESYYRKGDYTKAKRDYNQYFKTTNETGTRGSLLATYGLAYCNFRSGNYNEAYRLLDRMVKTKNATTLTDKATVADAWGRIGDCYFQARQYSNAEGAYDKAIATDPSTSDYAVYQKAFSQGLLGRYTDKIGTLDYLIENYPVSDYADDALFEKGRSYVQLDNNLQALTAFRSLIDKYPKSRYAPSAGNEIALLYYQAGNTAEAVGAYKHVITTYPGSEEANVAMRDLKSLCVEGNDVDTYIEFALQTKGMVTVDASERDSLTYTAAEQAYMRGNNIQAKGAFEKYLQQYPNGAYALNAHYHLGCILRQQDNYDGAITHLRAVAAKGGSRYCEEATRMVADMAYDHKDYALASDMYKELKTITDKSDVRLHAQAFLVRAAYARSDWNTIIEETPSLLADKNIAPDTAVEMRWCRAKACLATKQNDQALTDLTVLAKDTRSAYGAEAKYLLAQLYYDTGKTKKAENEVLDYINVSTPHSYWLARSFILLADVYTDSGRTIEARQYLLSLKQNYSGNDDIAALTDERLAKLQ